MKIRIVKACRVSGIESGPVAVLPVQVIAGKVTSAGKGQSEGLPVLDLQGLFPAPVDPLGGFLGGRVRVDTLEDHPGFGGHFFDGFGPGHQAEAAALPGGHPGGPGSGDVFPQRVPVLIIKALAGLRVNGGPGPVHGPIRAPGSEAADHLNLKLAGGGEKLLKGLRLLLRSLLPGCVLLGGFLGGLPGFLGAAGGFGLGGGCRGRGPAAGHVFGVLQDCGDGQADDSEVAGGLGPGLGPELAEGGGEGGAVAAAGVGGDGFTGPGMGAGHDLGFLHFWGPP